MPLLPNGYIGQYKGLDYDSDKNKRYKHEEYSITIIKEIFRPLIEKNPMISAEDVTALLEDKSVRLNVASLLWKGLISGQLDADRADYLLRDSKHLGVSYGLYDRDRLVSSMTLAENEETQAPVIAIQEKGWHLAESLVIARYQMFSQVYFHRVRRIYDHHICCAAKEILQQLGFSGVYPEPSKIESYIDFDDWKINAALKENLGGKHGDLIMKRQHYKCVAAIDNPDLEAIDQMEAMASKYQDQGIDYYFDKDVSTKWYRDTVGEDILIEEGSTVQPLSKKSIIVNSMKAKPQLTMRLYAERRI
jgi:HD superfamily phosphohydrolase